MAPTITLAHTQGQLNMDEKLLIASIGATTTMASGILTWLFTRKKNNADIAESLANAMDTIVEANQKYTAQLISKIDRLESDYHKLSSKLDRIGELVLRSEGDHVSKVEIAKVLKD